MFQLRDTRVVVMALGLALTGCASPEDDPELNETRQEFVASLNGLKSINGLRSTNGMKAINGLRTFNGLRADNGLTTTNGIASINGLRTFNGMKAINGLSVDCRGKTPGVDCTGEADGLLSAATGMLSSDDGINTAKYLVRCALPAGDGVRLKDYTGALIELHGELGVAPGWGDGQCDARCEEEVSACLMALTNGDGDQVSVELSAHNELGAGHSSSYRRQEAAFYGNLFSDPPAGYFCIGSGFSLFGNQWTSSVVGQRACGGYGYDQCPYEFVGFCNWEFQTVDTMKCSFSNGAAKSCKDNHEVTTCKKNWWGGQSCSTKSAIRTWSNPITTYRR
jgi:hypothetical protein